MRLLSAVRDFVAILAVAAVYLPAVVLSLLAAPLQRILDTRSVAGDGGSLPVGGPRDMGTSGRQLQPAAEDRSRGSI
jgi:hypothetical protein